VERISIHDMELADTVQAALLRHRLRRNVSSDGTIDEDDYAELVAREVERAQTMVKNMTGRKEG